MVHYNSWFDVYSWQDEGWNPHIKEARHDIMNEEGCLRRIHAFGQELVVKRGVKLDSFLWDDGWDDPKTLWEFDRNKFPNGFKVVSDTAKAYGAGTGVWLSPWGGYGSSATKRLQYGKKHGFETMLEPGGTELFAVSGPNYRSHFLKVALKMKLEEHVNMFKLDGVGQSTHEIEAMLELISQIRSGDPELDLETKETHSRVSKDLDETLTRLLEDEEPTQEMKVADKKDSVWINLTTGTWPSPFFLLWADSIWRGDGDLPSWPPSYVPEGLDKGLSRRQAWIKWRNTVLFELVVQRSPFFPISQMMIHGVVLGSHGEALMRRLDTFIPFEFEQEVWSFLGLGLQLQELYVAPTHMTRESWDILAKGLRWARREAAVLRDGHWAFGNPAMSDIYCTASWDVASARGFMFLHNPRTKGRASQPFKLADVLELPNFQRGLTLEVAIVKSAARHHQAIGKGRSLLQHGKCKAYSTRHRFMRALLYSKKHAGCQLAARDEIAILMLPTEVLVLEVRAQS
eukprot:gnl/TRDRNA2_/TRDRNA2_74926_c0_seq1.p1 gnl/TRDRNA2_/TRDRNA2_74926_c0~~gnl/TRDRNA2_/TRDRNA2_74926_c0_seq1.p1  ORF type:complete len:563 (+),score=86.76 gnl/TRDRNA2_/TRDRNA2_74926_c0_seq1:148-1689(+)